MNKIHLHNTRNPIDIPKYHSLNFDQMVKVKNNSVESVYMLDMLDYHNKAKGATILQTIYDKLITNGELIIQSPDLKQLIICMNFNKIDFNQGKSILYDQRIIMHQMEDIINKVCEHNFKCKAKKYINTFECFLEFNKI